MLYQHSTFFKLVYRMNQIKFFLLASFFSFFSFNISLAQSINPILKLDDPNFLYAADPAAEVFNGKVYVYCSHDQPDAKDYSSMQDYLVLESSDLKTWKNHGVVIKPREYSWAQGQMNAPDVAYKNGWYYLYFPYDKTYIGVSKSKSPTGPWEEAVKDKITTIFDPTVFIDDDGQAYIYGSDNKVEMGDKGKQMWGAKLKDNMIELDGPWFQIAPTTDKISEAVTIFKRNGVYYWMARAGNKTAYWMADTPIPSPDYPVQPKKKVHTNKEGYASLKGFMTLGQGDAPSHMSAIEFKNQWYYFYHRGKMVNEGSYNRRSACFDPLYFNEDGTIKTVKFSLEKTNKSEYGKGTVHLEAENFSDSYNTVREINLDIDAGESLAMIDEKSYVVCKNIDFGSNTQNKAIPFFIRAIPSRKAKGGTLEVRLDSKSSKAIASIPLKANGQYMSMETTLPNVKGKHTLYLSCNLDNIASQQKSLGKRAKKGNLMTINWLEYSPQN